MYTTQENPLSEEAFLTQLSDIVKYLCSVNSVFTHDEAQGRLWGLLETAEKQFGSEKAKAIIDEAKRVTLTSLAIEAQTYKLVFRVWDLVDAVFDQISFQTTKPQTAVTEIDP